MVNFSWSIPWHSAYPQLLVTALVCSTELYSTGLKNITLNGFELPRRPKPTIQLYCLQNQHQFLSASLAALPYFQRPTEAKLSQILYSLFELYNDESNRGYIDLAKVLHVSFSAGFIEHSMHGWLPEQKQIEIFPSLNFPTVPMSSQFLQAYWMRFRISYTSANTHLTLFWSSLTQGSPHHTANQATSIQRYKSTTRLACYSFLRLAEKIGFIGCFYCIPLEQFNLQNGSLKFLLFD